MNTKADGLGDQQMKNIKKLLIVDGILFLVAGIITVVAGQFTIASYGKFLIICGLVPMTIGVVSQVGSRQRPMPYSYRPNISVSQQHSKDIKEMQSNTTFLLHSIIAGIIPVLIGLIFMNFFH